MFYSCIPQVSLIFPLVLQNHTVTTVQLQIKQGFRDISILNIGIPAGLCLLLYRVGAQLFTQVVRSNELRDVTSPVPAILTRPSNNGLCVRSVLQSVSKFVKYFRLTLPVSGPDGFKEFLQQLRPPCKHLGQSSVVHLLRAATRKHCLPFFYII